MSKHIIFMILMAAMLSGCASSVNIAFVDSKDDPASVKYVDLDSGTAERIFCRGYGKITALAMDGLGRLYFADYGNKSIFEARPGNGSIRAIFTHTDRIRDLQLRKVGGTTRLYFSDATGPGGDGNIYYLNEAGQAVPYYRVGYTRGMIDVAGYWDGGFTFDDEDNLYLCSGDRVPASIYRIAGAGSDAVSGNDTRIYTDRDGPIMGIQYVSKDKIYFVSHGSRIYRLDLEALEKEEVYKGNGSALCDLFLVGKIARNTTGNYVGSLKSTIYHSPSCRWAKEISEKNRVWFQTPEEAVSEGYKACRVCRPT